MALRPRRRAAQANVCTCEAAIVEIASEAQEILVELFVAANVYFRLDVRIEQRVTRRRL